MKEVSRMKQKQYQSKNVQASDEYMETVEREITRAIANGAIEIAVDDDDANSDE